MKTIPSLFIGVAMLNFSNAAIIYPSASNSFVNGTRSSDWWIYEPSASDPALLVEVSGNPAKNPVDALTGNASAPAGNLELFANSMTPLYSDMSALAAFSNKSPIFVTGTLGSTAYTASSLNGNDWFIDNTGNYNLNYGANNFANTWWMGFVSEMNSHASPSQSAFLAANQSALFNLWLNSGGFKELSDPNIAYLYLNEGSGFTIGLTAFQNGTPEMRNRMHDVVFAYAISQGVPILQAEAYTQNYLAQIPDGIQFSEVVKFNGQNVFSFDGTPSGVATADGSYTGIYEVTVAVPEPSSFILSMSAALLAVVRRKR